MKVLIVDDEFFIRKNICDGIKWDAYAIDTVLECDNGADAIEICRKQDIDIIISDIRMLDMNGIESSRIIREICPNIKIIFISGYPEKDFLKDAIHLQAVSFLEKPIDMEELSAVLSDLVHTIKKEQGVSHRLHQADKLEKRRLKTQLARDFATIKNTSSLKKSASEADFPLEGNYLACIAGFSPKSNIEEDEQYLHSIYHIWEQQYEDCSLSLAATFRNHHLLLFFGGDLGTNNLLSRRKISQFLQNIYTSSQTTTTAEPTVRMGISSASVDFSHISCAYEQSCVAFLQAFYLQSGFYAAYSTEHTKRFQFDKQLLKTFQRNLANSQLTEFNVSLSFVNEQLYMKRNTLPSEVYSFYCDLADMFWSFCRQRSSACFSEFTDKYQLMEHIKGLLFLRDLSHFFQEKTAFLLQESNDCQFGNETVNQIARYISLHYQSPDLSLAEISENIHMAPNYIAGLFKKYTSDTVNQYITNYRIAVAENLLLTTDQSIREVALNSGFREQGYFSRVFQKQTHLTPSEYRRQNQ